MAVPESPPATTTTSKKRPKRWLPSFGLLAAATSILATAALVFVAGAAAMHFRVPPADSLTEAFTGAERWFAAPLRDQHPPDDGAEPRLELDRPGRTADGFTLCTTTQRP